MLIAPQTQLWRSEGGDKRQKTTTNVEKSAGGKIGRREREGAERGSTGREQVGGGSGASRASGTSELSDNRKRKGKAQEARNHN